MNAEIHLLIYYWNRMLWNSFVCMCPQPSLHQFLEKFPWLRTWKSFSCVWLFATPWIEFHVILQARIVEWVDFLFFRGSSQPRGQTQVSCTAGGFFSSWATREAQEYCSGLPCPPPGDLPNPGVKPRSPALQEDSLPTELSGKPTQKSINRRTEKHTVTYPYNGQWNTTQQ